ncbi:hypothetical protein X740_31690 [Mesorhizobium sp. LNHC221B00]|nr:hypothetical protein X740_31690 [Mesorhizobium sp. LNHC221B00]
MPKHLAQIALVNLLPAIWARIEMLMFRDVCAAVQLSGDRRAEVR